MRRIPAGRKSGRACLGKTRPRPGGVKSVQWTDLRVERARKPSRPGLRAPDCASVAPDMAGGSVKPGNVLAAASAVIRPDRTVTRLLQDRRALGVSIRTHLS